MLLMMLDARYAMHDGDNKLADADILVIDLRGYNFKHFLNAARHVKTIFLYFKYIQESVPVATTAAHILNPSWVVDKFMALIRPMLKKEVAESFRFHSQGLESLHEFVPKEILPSEYGGDLGSINDLHADWMKEFENKRWEFDFEIGIDKVMTLWSNYFNFRDYLMEESNWRITEWALKARHAESFY
jgi:hypothetical protein